jgi:hypothetical protein
MKFSTSLFIAISALCLSTAFAAPAGHGLQARGLEEIKANALKMAATAQKTAENTLKKVKSNPKVKVATEEAKKFAAKAQTDLKNVLS